MSNQKAEAIWEGDLKSGNGTMKTGSGTYEGAYTFASRFENGKGSNPEELIGAALAGCFSMALSNDLAGAGYNPESIKTEADVALKIVNGAPTITTIQLTVDAVVPEISEDEFEKYAENTKKNCPVSRALQGVTIMMDAQLKG